MANFWFATHPRGPHHIIREREEHRTSIRYKSAAAFGKRDLKLANRTTVRALAKPRGEFAKVKIVNSNLVRSPNIDKNK